MDVKQNILTKDEEDSILNTNFIKALVAIIIASIIVPLWVRFIINFSTNVFNLNPDSARWSFLIALFFTGFLILYVVLILDEDTKRSVQGTIAGISSISISNRSNMS
jgi:hypothetical protein